MKNTFFISLCSLFFSITTTAQEDSTSKLVIEPKKDTLLDTKNIQITISPNWTNWKKRKSPSSAKKIITQRWIVDLGFSNYVDNTNYTAAQSSNLVGMSVDKNRMEINDRKLTNVNIWFFLRKINLVKQVVNLKYGAGLELNNYRFSDAGIYFQKNPTKISYLPFSEAKKSKLVVNYFTVPVLLNLNFAPHHKKEVGFSGGVSFGYMYHAHTKTKSHGEVQKTKDDFDLNRWKLSYIGEISIGRNAIYGSYAFRSMWGNGLDMTPFSIGVRLKH